MGFFDQKRRYDDADFENGFIEPEIADADEAVEEEAEAVREAEIAEAPRAKSAFTGTEIGAAASLELKVVRPEQFEDSCDIADHLLAGRTVVLNMDFINKDVTRRLIDFLSGVAYSIDGSLKKIASNAYVITPSNVDVGDAQLRDKRQRAEQQEEEAPVAENTFGEF